MKGTELTSEMLEALGLIQSTKTLAGPTSGLNSVADALYLEVMAELSAPHVDVDAVIDAMAARCLAAARIGILDPSDLADMGSEDVSSLAAALARLAPIKLSQRDTQAALPCLNYSNAPELPRRLTARWRAGFEGPLGARAQGPRPETQASHALTTAVIARLIAGTDAALLSLAHNLHLSCFPDVPHLVERALGLESLALMEVRAKRHTFRALAGELPESLRRRFRVARRDLAANQAMDHADFMDRLFWLLTIAPPWLEPDNSDALAEVLCNDDHRRAGQMRLLNIVTEHKRHQRQYKKSPFRGEISP